MVQRCRCALLPTAGQAALVWVQQELLPSMLLCAGMCTQQGLEMLALNGLTCSPVSIIPPGFTSHPGSL